MKLLTFFLLLSVILLPASVFGQNAKVSLQVENASLVKVMDILEKSTDYRFVYQNSQVESVRDLTLNFKDADIRDVMKECLKGSGLTFNVVEMNIVIVPLKEKQVQQDVKKKKEVKGRVTDEDGLPLPGVSVLIDSTLIGAVTDVDGNYVLTYPEMSKVRLRFSFIGMQTKYVEVGNKTVINVVLMEEINRLDEVVAVGYGTTKAKDMTGAVSRLGKKEIETAPMGASVQSMLQGRAPGVNVMIGSASPTSPVSVIIRGSSSLSGDSQPLWVIDGVPEYSAGTSGDISNTLYNMNLTDVETIDILKDASATAIYGSRAANGVVIVTTKRGKKGMTPTLEFSARYGIQTMNANDFRVLNAEEYIALSKAAVRTSFFTRGTLDYFTRKYVDEAKLNAAMNTSQFDLESITDDLYLDDAYYESDTDWWDLMTRNAATQEYSLGIRGGSKESSYSASFFYKDQKGIVKGGSSKLLGGSFNFDASVREKIRFKLGLRATSRVANDKDNMIGAILDMRPDHPAYTEDGSISMISSYVENPLFSLKNINEGKGKDFTGSLGLEWDIIPGLVLRTNGTLKYGVNKSLTYERKYHDDGTSSSEVAKNESYTYVWDNTVTYLKTLGDHNLVSLLGFSIEKYETDGLSASGSNFPDDEVLTDLGSAATKDEITSSYNSNALVSTFARLEYKFKNRYLATFTFRADGSSRFGPDKRWGYFPSGALAWTISEENFLKDYSHIVSYLKLRASIGKTGSQNLGYYDWRTLLGSGIYNAAPGIKPSSLGNDRLQWESQLQKEIGLDYGFWDDRIRGAIGYYQKEVDNLLYTDPVPYSSSFTLINQNIGSLKNKGIEFDVKVDIIKNTQEDLTWNFDFNAARNVTTLEKLNSEDEYIGGGASDYFKVEVGGKTGILYGYKYGGRLFRTNEELLALKTIDPKTGLQRYYRDGQNYERPGDLYIMDLDGDGVITAAGDRTEIGNANPDFFGGFGTTLYWKGLMVNATFTYSVGADRFYEEEMNSAGNIYLFNVSKSVLKSWTMNPGVDRGYPRAMYYGWGDNSLISDRYVHDASFVRLSAFNVSYRFPKRLFGSSIVDAIDLTFQATNLFTWTKYPGMDPQGNFRTTNSAFYNMGVDYSTYPSARTYNVGIKITLK